MSMTHVKTCISSSVKELRFSGFDFPRLTVQIHLNISGWTLHFVLGPSLAAQNVRVFVNHPEDSKAGPNRHQYRELAWKNLSGLKSDVYDNFAEVHMVLAGSFNYYFTIDSRLVARSINCFHV